MTSRLKVMLFMVTAVFFAGCGGDAPDAPVAEVRPHEMTMHGDTRIDNYYWLREKENPEVIDYLKAENAYVEAALSGTKDFQAALFQEMIAYLQQKR